MEETEIYQLLIKILKATIKWLLILLAVIFSILVLIAVYLVIADFFYDGRFHKHQSTYQIGLIFLRRLT